MNSREEHTLSGRLSSYYESGMLYSVGILQTQGTDNGFSWLNDGDLLTVFNDKSKKEVVFQERLFYPVVNMELLVPDNISKKEWVEMLLSHKYAEVIPSKYVERVLQQEEHEAKLSAKKERKEKDILQRKQQRSLREYVKNRKN